MFQLLDEETRLRILGAREEHLNGRLEKLTAVETNFPLDRYPSEVIRQFRSETQSELEWIKRLRKIGRSGHRVIG